MEIYCTFEIFKIKASGNVFLCQQVNACDSAFNFKSSPDKLAAFVMCPNSIFKKEIIIKIMEKNIPVRKAGLRFFLGLIHSSA